MSKTIRVSEETWSGLQAIQRVRETMGETVARVVAVYEGLYSLRSIIGGVKQYGDRLDARDAEKEATER